MASGTGFIVIAEERKASSIPVQLVAGTGYLTPPTHTHTLTLENKEKGKQHSRMQGKRPKVRNFPSQERKQRKNHCSPVKL